MSERQRCARGGLWTVRLLSMGAMPMVMHHSGNLMGQRLLLCMVLILVVMGCGQGKESLRPHNPKEREFITELAERCRSDYERESCRNFDEECTLWGQVYTGEAICESLRAGESRKGIEELFGENGQCEVGVSVEVLCPDQSVEDTSSPASPVTSAPMSIEGPTSGTPRTKEERYQAQVIAHLPAGAERNMALRLCRYYDDYCPYWEFRDIGPSLCKEMRAGESRENLLGDAQFFGEEWGNAMIDAAIDVYCPEQRERQR